MSATRGVRSGDYANEVERLRALLYRQGRRARWFRSSRDFWRRRAEAAEWALRQRRGA